MSLELPQCQGGSAAVAVVGFRIIRCLAFSVAAVFGLMCTRFAGIWCDGPAGVT